MSLEAKQISITMIHVASSSYIGIQHILTYVNTRSSHETITIIRDNRATYYLNSLELVIEMMNNGKFSEMNYQDLYFLTMDIDDDTPICNLPLYFDDKDERDFRISSIQLQTYTEEHIKLMDDDGELKDLYNNSENDLNGTDSEKRF